MPAKSSLSRIKQLLKSAFDGHRLSLSRLLTLIENQDSGIPELLKSVFPKTGKALIWGITGPPGAGKSTLVDQILRVARKDGKKVCVLAIDPTSPFSGGAVLGDRVRMQDHAEDPGVFIRSVGTRGKRGGLSRATREAVMLMDAMGFDLILVETAGVGQTEFDVMHVAQTVMVVLVPESGDVIQAMKAGILEIANLFVVNKSDRPESDLMVKELIQMVSLQLGSEHGADHASGHAKEWSPPVLKTIAHRGVGADEVYAGAMKHSQFLKQGKGWLKKREEFAYFEIADILIEKVGLRLSKFVNSSAGKSVLKKVATNKLDPYSASIKIFK